jgi:hypothetical protein
MNSNKEFFNAENWSNTKELLEGRVMTTRTMYSNPEVSYRGAGVLMTTNELPTVFLMRVILNIKHSYAELKLLNSMMCMHQQRYFNSLWLNSLTFFWYCMKKWKRKRISRLLWKIKSRLTRVMNQPVK